MKLFAKRDGAFRPVDSRPLEAESELQRLFEEHPNLIPASLDGRRVVAREFPTDAGPVDHVVLDAAGSIVVVETKLAKNPDRRKVIAQAIDYAAQLTRYGQQEFLDKLRERKEGSDFSENWFKSSSEREEFHRSLENNLRDGRLTMLIVMDEVDERLREAVRFLNRATHFNCLIAEVRSSLVEGQELVGVTLFGEESIQEKEERAGRSSRRPAIDDEGFIEGMRKQGLGAEAEAFVKALRLPKGQDVLVTFTAQKCVLGPNQHDALFWGLGANSLVVWAPADVFEPRSHYLQTAAEPWRSRMTFRERKTGTSSGVVAEIDAKAATFEMFRTLIEFYLLGP